MVYLQCFHLYILLCCCWLLFCFSRYIFFSECALIFYNLLWPVAIEQAELYRDAHFMLHKVRLHHVAGPWLHYTDCKCYGKASNMSSRLSVTVTVCYVLSSCTYVSKVCILWSLINLLKRRYPHWKLTSFYWKPNNNITIQTTLNEIVKYFSV